MYRIVLKKTESAIQRRWRPALAGRTDDPVELKQYYLGNPINAVVLLESGIRTQDTVEIAGKYYAADWPTVVRYQWNLASDLIVRGPRLQTSVH